MDGSLPAALPPIAGQQPMQSFVPAGAARPMAAPNPVGRPSADPEVQEQRVVRSQEKKRIEGVLPKKAIDSKITVTRMTGGRVKPGAKATIVVLTSELEKAKQESGQAEEFSPEDYIGSKLAEHQAPDGVYQCCVVDRNNRRLPEYAPWEIEIGDAGPDEIVDDEVEEIDDPVGYGAGGFRGAPFNGMPPGYTAPPPVPPAAPPIDLQGFAGAMRGERQDEAKRQGETMSLFAMLMQTQQQAQVTMQQEQRARDEQYRREQAEREERYRREATEREERAEKRRAEFRQTMLAAAPILLPIVEKLFGLNKKEGPDATTLLLMDMVKQKAPDSDVMKSMAGVMAEMTKSQMQLQGAGATAAVEMQAKASQMVFTNLMQQMKEMADNRPASGNEKKGTLEQLAEIAGPIIASIQQQQQAAQPVAAPAAPTQAAVMQPAQPVALAAPVERPQKRAAPRPDRRNPAAWPDNRRLAIVIDTLRKLSVGEIPADQRWGVIQFVYQWIPPNVLQMVIHDKKDDVLTATLPVIMAEPPLMAWAQDEENQTFVEDAMADLKAFATNKVTDEHRATAIRTTAAFVARRSGAAAPAAPAESVKTVQAEPLAGPGAEEPVQQVNAEAANDAPMATPVEDAPPVETRRGRRSAGKRPPPASNGSHTTDASPAPEG